MIENLNYFLLGYAIIWIFILVKYSKLTQHSKATAEALEDVTYSMLQNNHTYPDFSKFANNVLENQGRFSKTFEEFVLEVKQPVRQPYFPWAIPAGIGLITLYLQAEKIPLNVAVPLWIISIFSLCLITYYVKIANRIYSNITLDEVVPYTFKKKLLNNVLVRMPELSIIPALTEIIDQTVYLQREGRLLKFDGKAIIGYSILSKMEQHIYTIQVFYTSFILIALSYIPNIS